MTADIGAVRRAPIRRTRPELIGGFTVKVDVAAAAGHLVRAAGHIVTGAADGGGYSVTVGIALSIEGDSGQAGDVSDMLGVGALAADATEVITAGVILTVARIWRISVTADAGTAGREGVAVVDGIRAVSMTGTTDGTAVVTIRCSAVVVQHLRIS